jgi:hypothetical protein
VITGRPNPSRQGEQTETHEVELKPGEMATIRLQAK